MLIASRSLKLRASGSEVKIDVRVFLPEPDASAWTCRYEIAWPEGLRVSGATGIDSVQALHLALQKIGVDLYMNEHHASGRLMWTDPGDGYGFPVPKNGRDFLVGSDKIFEG